MIINIRSLYYEMLSSVLVDHVVLCKLTSHESSCLQHPLLQSIGFKLTVMIIP